jgi:hypothetical protein
LVTDLVLDLRRYKENELVVARSSADTSPSLPATGPRLGPLNEGEDHHEDENDVQQPVAVGYAAHDRKCGEQDRHGTAKPCPAQERLLPDWDPEEEQGTDDGQQPGGKQQDQSDSERGLSRPQPPVTRRRPAR